MSVSDWTHQQYWSPPAWLTVSGQSIVIQIDRPTAVGCPFATYLGPDKAHADPIFQIAHSSFVVFLLVLVTFTTETHELNEKVTHSFCFHFLFRQLTLYISWSSWTQSALLFTRRESPCRSSKLAGLQHRNKLVQTPVAL